jgi:hypothetical protein
MKVGDLVRLKSADKIGVHDLEAYDPNDWVGIITKITEETHDQLEIWGTCMVMWRGRTPVNEFLDHLEVLQ